MYCLFIDSSFEPGVVALIADKELRALLFMSSREPSFPFEGLDTLLREHKLTKNQIDVFAVGIGPGSYTGIRTSVSVMQAFSFAANRPLISVPSLLRLVPREDGVYRVAIDARMGGAFTLHATVKGGRLSSEYSVEKCSIEQLIEKGKSETLLVDKTLFSRLKSHGEVPCALSCDRLVHIASFISEQFHQNAYSIGSIPSIMY